MRRIVILSPLLATLATLAPLAAVTACGAPKKTTGGAPTAPVATTAATACGTVTTAGGVPASVKVVRGSVRCAEAVSVFTAFFTQVADGRAPGQGTGGEIAIQGWSCVIHPPEEIQRTGRGAECAKGGTTVAADQSPR